MNEIAEMDNRIANDPIARAILSVTIAMKSDFGLHYIKQFLNDEDIRMYKRRLYAKTRDLEASDIVCGYEIYVDQGKTFCPTIPEFISCALSARKKRLADIKLGNEAAEAAELPPPQPVKAQPERIAVMLKEALSVKHGSEEERLARLKAKLQAHETLIQNHIEKGHISQGHKWDDHGCSVAFCTKTGVLSHSGGGNFYCAEHFKP